jgi:hypothetical protein
MCKNTAKRTQSRRLPTIFSMKAIKIFIKIFKNNLPHNKVLQNTITNFNFGKRFFDEYLHKLNRTKI